MNFCTPSRSAYTLSVAVILLVGTTLLVARAEAIRPDPSKQPGNVAKQVCQMIEHNHMSQMQIDDKISERLVDQYIKDLDAQKMYFLQSDIDQFNLSRHDLDDAVKSGNVDFAYNAYNLYLQRLDERIAVAQKLIDMPQDFTVDEQMDIDPKTLPWAKTVEELNERWRKRIKYDLLLLKLDKTAFDKGLKTPKAVKPNDKEPAKTPEEEARNRLHKRYKTIKDSMHKTDPEEVLEMYLTALCTTLDPHSSYMAPRTLEDFRIQMELSLDGIGAALRSEDGYTVVASIVPGGAAATDGRLKAGDKIIGVSNEKGEIQDIVEMKLTKVVDKIRGKRGTKVKLQVITGATGETKEYELTRQKIELKSSEVKGEIIQTGTRLKGTASKIGVIHIPSFYRDFRGAESGENEFKSTARDTKKVLADFKAAGGVDAIIIDLRTNGGGALTEAIEVSGLFIDEGPVVQVKNQKGKVKALLDEEPGVDYAGPLVVVTNRLSASASEIFAGVIKDYGRGLIVGDVTTHGKGTVQSVMNVGRQILPIFDPPDQGALKLTIQQFYRVNGDSTQNLGVPSDVILPSLLDKMDLGEQFLDNAMAFDRIQPAAHERFGFVSPEIVSVLREQERKRIATNADFIKTEKDIEKYMARKQRKSVSLNEEDLRKERIEEEQKTKDKADEADSGFAEGPVFPDNSYNNELLAITLDYIKLLRETTTAKK